MFSFRGSFKGDKVGIFWRNEAGRPREFPAKNELRGKEWKSTRSLFEQTPYSNLFRDATWLVLSYGGLHKILLRSRYKILLKLFLLIKENNRIL